MRNTLRALIRQIAEGARRIERIIGDLKDFARPGPRAPERFQLNDVVTHAVRLLRHLIQRRTDRFQVALAPDMPPLQGDRQQVEQVLVNLVINALEALQDRSGAVRIATAFDPNANVIVCEVQDAGVGIAEENVSRLGQPFFTTKAASGGTGLGLAIASSIVRQHSGRLRFASEPGRGTRAIVEFSPAPVASLPPEAVLHGSLP
jgi:signal transduction histidine kinase